MRGTGAASTVTRRHFILTAVSAAGGLMVGIAVASGSARAATSSEQPWNDRDYAPNEIDAWIAINPDDSILIRYQRSEMGQGSMTALPMMISEELQCDWSKVRIEYASANRSVREQRVYGNMYSHGSMSVRESQKMLQQVGASARERIIAAAAARWHVPASECGAAPGVVTHRPSGRTLRYGELAAEAAQVPGMVFASINACPVRGGKLKSVDESVLSGVPGIVGVVKLEDAVAVVATDSFWRAKRALSRLQPEWDVGAAGQVDS